MIRLSDGRKKAGYRLAYFTGCMLVDAAITSGIIATTGAFRVPEFRIALYGNSIATLPARKLRIVRDDGPMASGAARSNCVTLPCCTPTA